MSKTREPEIATNEQRCKLHRKSKARRPSPNSPYQEKMNYSQLLQKRYSTYLRASYTLSSPASSYPAQPPLGGDRGRFSKSEAFTGNSERSRPKYYWLLAGRLRALRGCRRARKIRESSRTMASLGKPPSRQIMKENLCSPKQSAYPDF